MDAAYDALREAEAASARPVLPTDALEQVRGVLEMIAAQSCDTHYDEVDGADVTEDGERTVDHPCRTCAAQEALDLLPADVVSDLIVAEGAQIYWQRRAWAAEAQIADRPAPVEDQAAEPVAWRIWDRQADVAFVTDLREDYDDADVRGWLVEPLYMHPAPVGQAVTDEQRQLLEWAAHRTRAAIGLAETPGAAGLLFTLRGLESRLAAALAAAPKTSPSHDPEPQRPASTREGGDESPSAATGEPGSGEPGDDVGVAGPTPTITDEMAEAASRNAWPQLWALVSSYAVRETLIESGRQVLAAGMAAAPTSTETADAVLVNRADLEAAVPEIRTARALRRQRGGRIPESSYWTAVERLRALLDGDSASSSSTDGPGKQGPDA